MKCCSTCSDWLKTAVLLDALKPRPEPAQIPYGATDLIHFGNTNLPWNGSKPSI